MIPDGCGVADVYPAPRGLRLAIEFSCAFGQAVVWMDAGTGKLQQPVKNSDSHFLAWAPDGEALYLKVNTINSPRIVRLGLDGSQAVLPLSGFTYDLAPNPGSGGLLFALSRGIGLGSELWTADQNGYPVRSIMVDPHFYLSLARWSPDGSQIALIKVPDSATPFTVGELWVMQTDGADARQLARADAGHGYAPAWSPDGQQIAFVARDNPEDARADQSTQALLSSLHIVNVVDGEERALTGFGPARAQSAAWQPVGNNIAVAVVQNDRMTVRIINATTGQQQFEIDAVCCPTWLRK